MMQSRMNKRRGFSLIEVLVVITIIAGLAALLARNVMGSAEEAKIQQCEIQIKQLMDGLQTFKLREGRWPKKSEGLKILTEPSGRSKTPIMERLDPDPWGGDFVYKPGIKSGDKPVIVSYGADGKPGGEGVDADIDSAEDSEENN